MPVGLREEEGFSVSSRQLAVHFLPKVLLDTNFDRLHSQNSLEVTSQDNLVEHQVVRTSLSVRVIWPQCNEGQIVSRTICEP